MMSMMREKWKVAGSLVLFSKNTENTDNNEATAGGAIIATMQRV